MMVCPLVLGLALPVKGLVSKTHATAPTRTPAWAGLHLVTGNTVTRRATAIEFTSWAVCFTATGCLSGMAHIAAVFVWLAWNVAGLWDDSNKAATCSPPIDGLCGCMWAVAMWLAWSVAGFFSCCLNECGFARVGVE